MVPLRALLKKDEPRSVAPPVMPPGRNPPRPAAVSSRPLGPWARGLERKQGPARRQPIRLFKTGHTFSSRSRLRLLRGLPAWLRPPSLSRFLAVPQALRKELARRAALVRI
jgi:hypothetical protein